MIPSFVEIELPDGFRLFINPAQVVVIEDAPQDSGYASLILMAATTRYKDGSICSLSYRSMLGRDELVEMFNKAAIDSAMRIAKTMHDHQ